MNFNISSLLSLLLLAVVCSCGSNANQSSSEESLSTEAEDSKLEGVSVWDQVSVRAEPGAKTTYKTALSIGESFIYTGQDSVVEEKTYAKIQLNDGEEGWSRKDFLVPGAKAAVIMDDASLYSRPDLLTKTDKSFSAMDIVASIETQDEWMNIRGKRADGSWLDEGWVKAENVSFNAADIATAKFASKALNLEDKEEKIKAIQEIVQNQDLGESKFIASLVVKLTDLTDEQEEVETDSIE